MKESTIKHLADKSESLLRYCFTFGLLCFVIVTLPADQIGKLVEIAGYMALGVVSGQKLPGMF